MQAYNNLKAICGDEYSEFIDGIQIPILPQRRVWKLRELQVTNVFCYGSDIKVFNFRDGITHLVGKNASGKTSLIQAII